METFGQMVFSSGPKAFGPVECVCVWIDVAVFSNRFCDLVNSITEEAWKGPEEGDCDSETLEVT